MPDIDANVTAGVEPGGYRRGTLSTDRWDQYVVPVEDRIVSYRGRASTFRIPGRAAVTQTLFTLFNNTAAGSGVLVDVDIITVDLANGAVKAVTVLPPSVRVHRLTALPTGGTTLPKVADNTLATTNALVVLVQDASADQTSGTAVAATINAGTMLTQEYAPRIVGTLGAIMEPADRMEFLTSGPLTLQPQQGVAVVLNAAAAGSIPITDMFSGNIRWTEYTRP